MLRREVLKIISALPFCSIHSLMKQENFPCVDGELYKITSTNTMYYGGVFTKDNRTIYMQILEFSLDEAKKRILNCKNNWKDIKPYPFIIHVDGKYGVGLSDSNPVNIIENVYYV